MLALFGHYQTYMNREREKSLVMLLVDMHQLHAGMPHDCHTYASARMQHVHLSIHMHATQREHARSHSHTHTHTALIYLTSHTNMLNTLHQHAPTTHSKHIIF